MLENKKRMFEYAKVPESYKTVFMTCSSTGAMEVVVMNYLSKGDYCFLQTNKENNFLKF